jgi:GNAT superfamily N-acetyltransferase
MIRQMDAPVTFRELSDTNRDDVLALRLAPGQDRFVSSVAESLQEAEEFPRASPWYRAVYVGGEQVGFVMVSWDCVPQPPEIIGPWFLWKLLIDERHQRHGYGREVVRLVTDLIREAGADDLLTSYVPEGEGGPGPFYEGLGFVPTGAVDDNGEIILRLDLRRQQKIGAGGEPPTGQMRRR